MKNNDTSGEHIFDASMRLASAMTSIVAAQSLNSDGWAGRIEDAKRQIEAAMHSLTLAQNAKDSA